MTVGKGGRWCFSVLTVLVVLLNIIVTLVSGVVLFTNLTSEFLRNPLLAGSFVALLPGQE